MLDGSVWILQQSLIETRPRRVAEVYKDDAAWNDHLDMQSESPEMKAQFAKYPEFLDGPVQIEYCKTNSIRSQMVSASTVRAACA